MQKSFEELEAELTAIEAAAVQVRSKMVKGYPDRVKRGKRACGYCEAPFQGDDYGVAAWSRCRSCGGL